MLASNTPWIQEILLALNESRGVDVRRGNLLKCKVPFRLQDNAIDNWHRARRLNKIVNGLADPSCQEVAAFVRRIFGPKDFWFTSLSMDVQPNSEGVVLLVGRLRSEPIMLPEMLEPHIMSPRVFATGRKDVC